MKYTVHYSVRFTREFETSETDPQVLNQIATWHARNAHGTRVEISQILPEGVPSQLRNDQPSQPHRTPPSAPPTGPKAPAGDQILAHVA